jgi:predicted transcriptional regulator
MKKLPRRDRLKIYGDLLAVLYDEAKTGKIVITRIMARSNVPFDRLKIYISELIGLGLIEDETSLKLTEKGKEYLREYKRVLDFIKRMGIKYR